MKVVVAGGGRFFLFKEAAHFNKRGDLGALISNFPKSRICPEGVDPGKIRNLPFNGYLAYVLHRFYPRGMLPWGFSQLNRLLHWWFGLFIRKNIIPADFYLLLSSFGLEAIEKIRAKTDAIIVVEHASFHQQEDKDLVLEDAKYWGVKPARDWSPEWVVRKEDLEFEAADYVLVPSHAVERSLIKHGVAAEKILINAYGVELSEFFPLPKEDDVFRVLQVGQVSQRKGIYTSIEAFVRADIKNSELVFVGPQDFDANLVERLAGPRRGDIKFEGAVPQNELVKHYGRASVMVMPSVADGFGLVVLQALACARPVLVCENVGASDYIKQGENGYVFGLRDSNALAEHLCTLASNAELLQSLSRNAVATVQRGLTWDDYCKRLEDILLARHKEVARSSK